MNYLTLKNLTATAAFLATSFTIGAADVALIGTTGYASLSEAFAAATEGQTIMLAQDTELTAAVGVDKSVTLDLNGHTVTNNVTGSRTFRVGAATLTIDGHGGKILTPESNTNSFGFVDMWNLSGQASAAGKLVINDAEIEGATNDGSLIRYRANGQTVELNNVTATARSSKTWSIVNGTGLSVTMTVTGGTYNYTSTVPTVGAFQAGDGSTVSFEGVKVNAADAGPVFEVTGSSTNAVFKDCDMTMTGGSSYFASCIAASNGASVTVDGGRYEANYPLYVYNSGATINVSGGEFVGHVAAIKADNKEGAEYSSKVVVEDGNFDGPVSVDAASTLEVKGGTYTADVKEYCAEGVNLVPTFNPEGQQIYTVPTADAVALIGTTAYTSLADAFAAATEGQTIVLARDTELTAAVGVDKSVTLDLNGHTVTNNVTGSRTFRVGAATLTIDGHGGKILTPESNTNSFGFVDMWNLSGQASAAGKLVINDAEIEGATNDGSLIRYRANGQTVELNNVTATARPSRTWSIVNGSGLSVGMTVNGGTYNYTSTLPTVGTFQAGNGSTVSFEGVKVNAADAGPVFEVIGSSTNAVFKDCDMTMTGGSSYFASCIAASNGADVTVDGGRYEADYPLYVYNSGATINVSGGEFVGHVAAIKVDNKEGAEYSSKVVVEDGNFDGPVSVDAASTLEVKGGTYTADVNQYCVEGLKTVKKTAPDGSVYYEVVTSTTAIVDVEVGPGSVEGRIYNLTGSYLGTDLDQLPAGIYICNGHKVYKK